MNNPQATLCSILQSGRYIDPSLSADTALYAETLLLSELLVAVQCGVMGDETDAKRLIATLRHRLLPELEAKMQAAVSPVDKWHWAEARLVLMSAIDAGDRMIAERFRSDLAQAAAVAIECLDEDNQVAIHLLRLQTVAGLSAREALTVFPRQWQSVLQRFVKHLLGEIACRSSFSTLNISQVARRWQLLEAASNVCPEMVAAVETAVHAWSEDTLATWSAIVASSTPTDRLAAYAALSRLSLLSPAALNALLDTLLAHPSSHPEAEVLHHLASCRRLTAEAEAELEACWA